MIMPREGRQDHARVTILQEIPNLGCVAEAAAVDPPLVPRVKGWTKSSPSGPSGAAIEAVMNEYNHVLGRGSSLIQLSRKPGELRGGDMGVVPTFVVPLRGEVQLFSGSAIGSEISVQGDESQWG